MSALEAIDAESEAVRKGFRITLDYMKSRVAEVENIERGVLNVCIIKLDNGWMLVGKSAPVGQLTMSQLREIAEQKMKDMNANDVDGAVRMLMGSARSMGITVVEG